jgi:hypothetical protein
MNSIKEVWKLWTSITKNNDYKIDKNKKYY